MKNGKKDSITIVLFIALVVLIVAINSINFSFFDDRTLNALVKDVIIRSASAIFVIVIIVVDGDKKCLNPLTVAKKGAILWCIPCLFVALANFPYTALASGSLSIVKPQLVWLFAIDCLLIGIFEEFLFRGILQDFIASLVKGKRRERLLTVFLTSAAFGLWHLFNLAGGANVGMTLLQVGYTFLVGAMLSAVVIKTGNLWLCVILHAIFDFGGLIADGGIGIAKGTPWDLWFWIFTAVFGAICAAHVVCYLIKSEN